MWDAALDIGRPDTAQEMVAKAEAAFKKADEIWNLRKGDRYVNDEARARFWNDRETARLALDMAQQQAGLPKRTKRMHRAKRQRNLIARSMPRRHRRTMQKADCWKNTRPGRTSSTRR
jgi:phage-related minor tail protein